MLESDFIKTVPSKPGVYLIYLYPLSKYYIGESVDIKRRMQEHLNGNGKKEIYDTAKIYGLDSLGFQVLEFKADRKQRLQLEQKYKLLYGLDRLVNSLSTIENGSNSKALLAFDKQGNFYKRFSSLSEAASFVCRNITTVSDSCLGKALFVGGYVWFYESDFSQEKLTQRLNARKERDIKKKQHLNILNSIKKEKQQKPVRAINEKEEYIFMSLSEAALYFETSFSNISACCLGKQKRIKNLEWSYINE